MSLVRKRKNTNCVVGGTFCSRSKMGDTFREKARTDGRAHQSSPRCKGLQYDVAV